MKNKIFGLLISVIFLTGAGCSGNKTEKMPGEGAYDKATTETNGAASGSAEEMAYICPMACSGSASHEPGKCPVCTMDLVKNPNYKGAAVDSTAQPIN